MRDGWTETTLGEICELITRGKAPSYCESDGVVVLNQKCVRNGRINFEFSRLTDTSLKSVPEWAFLQVGDTLINSTGVGTLGRASYISHLNAPTTFDSHLTLVRPRQDACLPAFVGLSLNSREADIEMFAGGSTGQTELSREAVNSFPITLPPIDEQRRIVDVLISVDNYINALQRQADTARTARNAVLHELLSSAGDDWTETSLGEIVTFEYGKPLKSENRDGEGFPVFGSAGEVGRHSEPLVKDGPVIIVGRKGTAGAVWWSDVPCSVIDTAYYVVQTAPNDLRFIYLLLGYLDLPSLNAQTGVPGLNRDRAYSKTFLLPTIAEQQRIVEIISAMDEVIRATDQAISDSKNLRTALMSDLLSGSHEIPESYDSFLEAV